MTTKYSVGDGDDPDDGRDADWSRWESDRRVVLAQWSSKPFHGVTHRHETVEQRIVVEYHHGVGADLIHEARSEDTAKFSDDWAPVQVVEVREWGARHDRRPEARWLDD